MRQHSTSERSEQNVETQGYCMRTNRINPSPLGVGGEMAQRKQGKHKAGVSKQQQAKLFLVNSAGPELGGLEGDAQESREGRSCCC